jgi:hypothetical protein
MTEGSVYAHHDPSVLISTKPKGVLINPLTARSAAVSYFIGEAKTGLALEDGLEGKFDLREILSV